MFIFNNNRFICIFDKEEIKNLIKTIKKTFLVYRAGSYNLNKDREIVIIGCGASGGTAAQFAHKTDRKAKITILEQGKYPQYSKCGLPYAISGIIPNFNDLFEFSEEWFKKNNIDLKLETYVEKIDTKKQIIYAKKGNKKIEKNYDYLIICTGASPTLPSIENLDSDGVFVLRTIDDAKAISSYIKKKANAVIVGAGLIGIELAESLYKKDMKVTIVEALSNILPTVFDDDISELIKQNMPDDINLYFNHFAKKIEVKNGKIKKLLIKDRKSGENKKIDADILVISTGVKPEIELAKKIGCKIGETGSIVVNEKAETSVKNVYAAGDCTEYIDFVTKKPVHVGLGSIAVRQGIAAGVNAAGGKHVLPKGVLQTFTSEFFDIEFAGVGSTTNLLDVFSTVSGKLNGSSLPDYYPGGKKITIKCIADEKTGRILGVQAVGDKAAQRVNTFACAILGNMDIDTFRKLETAYAPPIAPTLDVETLVGDIVALKLSRKK